MNWFARKEKRWFRTRYRVSCWISGYLVSTEHIYPTEEGAAYRARYLNSPEDVQSLMDYAQAWQGWYQ